MEDTATHKTGQRAGNRLITGSGSFGTVSYTYDQVGKRISETVNGTQTTYAYGSYNKLLSAGSTTYTYDPNGNMITKISGSNSWAYSYDYENRLKQAMVNGITVLQAMYDGDGRRVRPFPETQPFTTTCPTHGIPHT